MFSLLLVLYSTCIMILQDSDICEKIARRPYVTGPKCPRCYQFAGSILYKCLHNFLCLSAFHLSPYAAKSSVPGQGTSIVSVHSTTPPLSTLWKRVRRSGSTPSCTQSMSTGSIRTNAKFSKAFA